MPSFGPVLIVANTGVSATSKTQVHRLILDIFVELGGLAISLITGKVSDARRRGATIEQL